MHLIIKGLMQIKYMHSLLYGFMQFLYDGKAVSYPQSIKENIISLSFLLSLSLCSYYAVTSQFLQTPINTVKKQWSKVPTIYPPPPTVQFTPKSLAFISSLCL